MNWPFLFIETTSFKCLHPIQRWHEIHPDTNWLDILFWGSRGYRSIHSSVGNLSWLASDKQIGWNACFDALISFFSRQDLLTPSSLLLRYHEKRAVPKKVKKKGKHQSQTVRHCHSGMRNFGEPPNQQLFMCLKPHKYSTYTFSEKADERKWHLKNW